MSGRPGSASTIVGSTPAMDAWLIVLIIVLAVIAIVVMGFVLIRKRQRSGHVVASQTPPRGGRR
jgi:hypothetical protein